MTNEDDALEVCRSILRDHRDDRVAKNMLASEVAVIDRLLDRGLELAGAYVELVEKLSDRPSALEVLFDCVCSTAAFWNPQANDRARDARDELRAINHEVGILAERLAELVDRREAVHNRTGFASNTHYHPIGLVEDASKSNGHFTSYVKEPLDALRCRFDLKYWPSIGDVLRVLARDADVAEVHANDRLTDVATRSPRRGLADFVKALFASLDENGVRDRGFLPRGLRLTDATIASITNAALGLSPDRLIGAEFVKRLRQRERERSGSGSPLRDGVRQAGA
ncbi:hypothetical protein [Sphingomonas parapaucimobilis]|uniref:hypothetical protein n=1 Tax=Sphingomonas parapaucimobilis TaxID=28213 RepID=UPI00321B115F